MDPAPEVLEDTSETLSPLGEKIAPVVFFLFVGVMVYLAYRDTMLAARVFGLTVVAFGVAAVLYSARAISRGRRSLGWPTVEATVTRSGVFTTTDTNRAGSQPTVMYEHFPAVWYEYEVQGRRYRSKRLIFLRTNYTRSDAEAAVGRYSVGSRVTAHYNRANPKLAVLEPGLGTNAGHYVKGFAIGAAFVLIGLVIAFGVPWMVSAFD
jgi:hypothetical protein